MGVRDEIPEWLLYFSVVFTITGILSLLFNTVVNGDFFTIDAGLSVGLATGSSIGLAIRKRMHQRKMRKIYGDEYDDTEY